MKYLVLVKQVPALSQLAYKGWLPRQHQVGLTGRAIAPRFYFAIGIRGAFEHMVGLRRAGTIVAINQNPAAPIFKQADLGVVADWTTALPVLMEEVAKYRDYGLFVVCASPSGAFP